MNRLVQICIGIIGVPFLIVVFSYLHNERYPQKDIQDVNMCAIEIITKSTLQSEQGGVLGTGVEGVAYFDQEKKVGVTAFHVVESCVSGGSRPKTCFLNGQEITDIKRQSIDDLAYFNVKQGYCEDWQKVGRLSGMTLVTFYKQQLKKISVQISNNQINFQPNYGQSGSPVFSGDILIGVVSTKTESGARVVLLTK